MKTNQMKSDYVSPEIETLTISVEEGFAASGVDNYLPYSPDAPDYEDGVWF